VPVSKRIRMAGHTECMGDMGDVYKILARNWRRPMVCWEDNIEVDLK